jgi:Autotransporter beta-domain
VRLQSASGVRKVSGGSHRRPHIVALGRFVGAALLLASTNAFAQSLNLTGLAGTLLQCATPPNSQNCGSLLNAVPPKLSAALLDPIQNPKVLSNLLNGVTVGVSTSQQLVPSLLASTALQTNQQISNFALSDISAEIPASESGAVLQAISPVATSFGISGVSHTSHDGFLVSTGGEVEGRSPDFEALDAGITLGVRFDASRAANWPKDSLTIGIFGNYTNSDVDFHTNPVLRELGIKNAGDASLNSGSGGGYALATNGSIYGLALASGQFGSSSVNDTVLNSDGDFDTSGFSSSILGGIMLPAWSGTRLDLRGGLNYLTAKADSHTDSVGVSFGEGHVNEFSGTLSARLFSVWTYRQTVIRPFAQAGIDYRFHYENEIEVENVNFSFAEGRTTLFERLGVDFDVGRYAQAYLAIRGDHNKDFDTVAGQAGLTIKLN